ncbi:MAG TPA: hypothetical protein VLA15_03455, partial [Desulfurivibrionaceae bacterium]|nr:hypothetical protein [Desulfurivibrionaceae bacterium]
MEARRDALRKRLQERQQAAKETKGTRLTGKALDNHLKEYQMELIRRGDAPLLPVPVTPDMEKQLVEEGLLSPDDAGPAQGSP